MSHSTKTPSRSWRGRALSLLLAAVMLVGAAPGLVLPVSAHWADPYLDQLVDWGIMRADQTSDPDAPVTRAEFAAIINRAYGYDEVGPIPFTDVETTDWFYDDIAIAYTAGYMAGTSATTASPNSTLNREQAVVILGRNMMLQETPGESLAFGDSRDISTWARGTIKTAVDNYIVTGYPDNTFGPQDPVSKGQMAVLVTQCIGTPVSEEGSQSLGGVFGNVTITSPNVTLHDTTISGDLYVSGGVGLGGILLQNVDVLGRIIVSGTGESEAGSASVVMRNVNANEMLVDNMRNKTVTVRADGITQIGTTTVRTTAYLEDNNTDDKGLMKIVLDGEPNTRLTLAGRIKEVVDKTPNSTIQVAKGSVAKLTVDEAATGSTVQIDRNTVVRELNLDVGTNVTGEGDIDQLNINAPGSVVSMLPEKIYIRPGLTANIAGVIMDHTAAEEGSTDPRLLSGYPAAKDVAPTSFRADFSGNKAGTVYWAVSSISDGSVGEDDLIEPPSYGSKAVRNGSVSVPTGGTEVNTRVTGLSVGGSYYLSAILVDGQNNRSVVKAISFTTPDNTVPALAQGYPYMSLVTDTEAQVTVMPTKDCKMYYAVLPRNAQAPTADNMKAASVSNNLGYGVVDVQKNKEEPFMVSHRLEELKDYTLYLWLTDADGVNSSAVIPVQFTTKDMTPPEFVTDPELRGNPTANSVPMTATINENGTIFWVAVEEGAEYPRPHNGYPADNVDDGTTAKLDSQWAKLQVANGMNCISSGRVTAQADRPVDINVTGLQPEKAYDLYYLAQDTAGNYSITVKKILGGIHTLDTSKPTVAQSFTSMNGNDPMANTDIILTFSEPVAYGGTSFRDLYANANAAGFDPESEAMKDYMEALHSTITLYQYVPGVSEPGRDYRDGPKVYTEEDVGRTVSGKQLTADDVVIDFRKAVIEDGEEEGTMAVRFPNSGLKLTTGNRYFFVVSGVTDTSIARNALETDRRKEADYNTPSNDLRIFLVALATVGLEQTEVPAANDDPFKENDADDKDKKIDLAFYMKPNGTEQVNEKVLYDLLFWSEERLSFGVYIRVVDALDGKPIQEDGKYVYPAYNEKDLAESGLTGVNAKENGWVYMGAIKNNLTPNPQEDKGGTSLYGTILNCAESQFPRLNTLKEKRGDTNLWYEVGLCLTKVGDSDRRPTWSMDSYSVEVNVAAGTSLAVPRLKNPSEATWTKLTGDSSVSSVGSAIDTETGAASDTLVLEGSIGNTQVPQFRDPRPTFTVTASTVDITVNLDGEGWVYYLIAPVVKDTPNAPPGIDTTATVDGSRLTNLTLYNSGKVPTKGGLQPDGSTTDPNVDTTDPEEGRRYKQTGWVIEPRAEQVQTPEEYNNNYLKYDTVRYYRGGGDVPLGVTQEGEHTVTGLQADQEYFCYIVLAGLTDPTGTHSETYLYSFKTRETAKPRISPDDQEDGNILISTGEASEDAKVASTLAWRVITASQAEAILRRQPLELSKEATDAGVTGYSGVENLWDALNTVYMPTRVIPANRFGLDQDGYSVFDVLASSDQKYALGRLIYYGDGDLVDKSGVTLERVNSGNTTTAPNSNPDRDYKSTVPWWTGANSPTEDVEYVFLIAGHNTANNSIPSSSGSGQVDYSTVDSYRLSTVINRDRTPPQLWEGQDGAGGTMNCVNNTSNAKFNGSIYLAFNKAVGWKPRGSSSVYSVQAGNSRPVDEPRPAISGTAGRVGIGYNLSPIPTAGRIYTTGGFDSTPKDEFTIYFEGVQAGTYRLLTNGQISTLNGEGTTGSAITIQLVGSATRVITLPNGDIIAQGEPYAVVTFPTVGGDRDSSLNTHYIMVDNRGSSSTGDPSLTLDKYSFTLNTHHSQNKTETLTANLVNPPSGSATWSWRSSNTLVATVSDPSNPGPATVTAVGPGDATITATVTYRDSSNNISWTREIAANVTVVSPKITITGGNIEVRKNNTYPLRATVTDPADGTTSIVWSSDDRTVADVNPSTGVVTANARGTTIITATYKSAGTDITDSIVVTVTEPVYALTVTNDLGSAVGGVTPGGGNVTIPLTATVTVDGNSNSAESAAASAEVTWTCSDSTVAELSSTKGSKVSITVKGAADQTFTITVTYPGTGEKKTFTYTITPMNMNQIQTLPRR